MIKHLTDRDTSVQFGGVFEHLARYCSLAVLQPWLGPVDGAKDSLVRS